ncbi:MAG: helix-turn-helix domain-containing protein [Dethiobacter sp.]|jgi:transcriptional regulator with XRE-family HTH domain|nr:helix-turn-helix domain-containing protein [Dethiobacter sp.]
MDYVRIGEKLVSLEKIFETVKLITKMRSDGLSQQEVATKLKLDRTFISRLENIGSIRRGGRIGFISFPVANKDELHAMADRNGIEQRLILSNQERWQLVEQKSGMEFFNQMMSVIEGFRQCDTVLVFCSSKWNNLAGVLLDNQVLTREIAPTPVTGDIYVDPQEVEKVLVNIV